MKYNKSTLEFLSSFEFNVSKRLIKYEMEHNYTQQEFANILSVELNDLVKVECNYPNLPKSLYIKFDSLLHAL